MRIFLIISLFLSFAFTACTVNKRDPETPVPTFKKVSTDFFFEFNKDRTSYKSRRFLFGMSSEDKTGRYRDVFWDHWNTYGSSNVEFEFNEEGDKLIGRLVNPTYPNDKNKWTILISFNVSGSYYEENRVDSSGRTGNDVIRRSNRSDPRARPFIDLELSSMTVHQFMGIGPWAAIRQRVTQKVEDVEWGENGDFLGFTTTSLSAGLGPEAQTVDRINFMRIEPNAADFEETPYNKENDKYTQMLDIVSERPNHFGERLKLVHWDINATTKKKHKIYLHNFPEEYLQVAIDSVESWNDVFEPLVGYRPLEHEVSDRKYAFDLRYHTIHWVDDIRLSAAGPLGLANMAADITNGKILWTGSIIWGGMLDQYAASYVPSFALDNSANSLRANYVHNIDHIIPAEHNQANDIGVSNSRDPEYRELDLNPVTWSQIVADVGLEQPAETPEINLGFMDRDSEFYRNLPQQLTSRNVDVPIAHGSFSFDADNHAIDALNDLRTAVSEIVSAQAPIDVFEVKKTSIRKTIVHEIGHTLGLAHNFMSNIMPKKGDVPNTVYDELKAKADEGMTNKSSIMGYPDGRTIVRTKYEEMKPGPNDVERIRYLYKQEYPVYDKTARGQGDYTWESLGADGRILPQIQRDGKTLTPAFLPGCNDIEASYYMNPYCNRHDRGYNAVTLVENYFTRYEDTLYRLLESNIDSLQTRNYIGLERYLWRATSQLLTRSRLFYDFMRLKYEDEIKDLKAQNGDIFATYNNLLNFSKNCRSLKGKSSSELRTMRSDVKTRAFIEEDADGNYQINEFGDLCLATTIYFDRISKLLETEGKEYTEIDYLNRRVPGGLRSGDTSTDYSQMFGSWKRMTLLPLKFNIMQNVLIPRAMISTRYGSYLLYPYGRPDTSYSLATLFPEEYLNVVLQLTKSAMRIENGDEEPRISRSLMYLGYFLGLQSYTADYRLFPSEILDAVVDQTRFRYSGAFIEVDATKEDGTDLAKSFQGSIYNRFNTSGKESLGNVYLYNLDRFIFKSQAASLALPVTPINWRTPSKGYSAAIKLDYAPNINFEELDAFSPRSFFIDEYKAALERCVEGDDSNGLSSYFKPTGNFEGIRIPLDIHERESAYKELNDSIVESLTAFSLEKDFDLSICEKALRSQRALVLGASLMNGYFFRETEKYIEQGSN